MLTVGLTGGTGAGKSTAAAALADLGAVVVDADALAREVVAPGTEGLAAVAAEFGEGVVGPEGALDRAALAAVVFADDERRRALEAITHPRIAARTRELLAEAPDDAIVVHDVPLLVEQRMGARYHLVVVVTAPEATRVSRLVAHRGMAEDDARARVRAQAGDDDRRAVADVLLDNTGHPDDLVAAVARLWEGRLRPFEENVRRGVPAVLPGDVVPADPTWGVQAARVAARLRHVVPQTLRVEHVGPTAVPGTAAVDVLDLDLHVPATGDGPADDVTSVLARLAGAGFVPAPDHVPAAAAGEDGPVLLSCDPGRAVRVHVRTVRAGAG